MKTTLKEKVGGNTEDLLTAVRELTKEVFGGQRGRVGRKSYDSLIRKVHSHWRLTFAL